MPSGDCRWTDVSPAFAVCESVVLTYPLTWTHWQNSRSPGPHRLVRGGIVETITGIQMTLSSIQASGALVIADICEGTMPTLKLTTSSTGTPRTGTRT